MYNAKEDRYDTMHYRRSGKSGVKLPELSLGLWHNFGSDDDADAAESIVLHAFDRGITHFDLANNYGPPPGSAGAFRCHDDKNLRPFRDELVVSSKAGYGMWPGPYGDFGSRKYRCELRPEPCAHETRLRRHFLSPPARPDAPLEETMGALDYIVRSGRALYAGISNYGPDDALRAIRILRELGTPCLIHQGNYSMLNRWVEDGLLDVLDREGVGGIWYSPLAQGLLTGRYLDGSIPDGSRASRSVFLKPERLTPALLAKLNALASIAGDRGETLSRLAIKWLLRHRHTTSVLIGASSVAQLDENLLALEGAGLSDAELNKIETILAMPE